MNMPLNASFLHPNDPIEQARYNMVEQQIRPWNVFNAEILALLRAVRREDFVPPEHVSLAFMDLEIPLRGEPEEALRTGQCMLAPKVEARMLQDLKVQKTDRVLEIGTGSGFMAALLAHLAAQVVTLEIHPELAEMARENLVSAGIQNAAVRLADGTDAIPDGPFDVIVLSGSVAAVPPALLAQLRDGGRLMGIVGSEPSMHMNLVQRVGERFVTTMPWDTNAARLVSFPQPSSFKF